MLSKWENSSAATGLASTAFLNPTGPPEKNRAKSTETTGAKKIPPLQACCEQAPLLHQCRHHGRQFIRHIRLHKIKARPQIVCPLLLNAVTMAVNSSRSDEQTPEPQQH